MFALDFLEQELGSLREAGLLRVPDAGAMRQRAEQRAEQLGLPCLDASSNDYLGLASGSVSRETLFRGSTLFSGSTDVSRETSPCGAGASRLIHGTHPHHQLLEQALATWVAHDTALLFSSGYVANVSLLSAVAGPGDLIVSDRLNHASIIDGCRLARAEVRIAPHRDADAVERALTGSHRRRFVVTESYFSMDGDSPDLLALRATCDRHRASLIVDEAHALGVFGPRGSGSCRAAGVRADAVIGTLGKSLGTQGAFVAGPRALREWLWNRARGFVFSTATSPLLAGITLQHLEFLQNAEALRADLNGHCDSLRAHLENLEVPVLSSHGPILPIPLNSPWAALDAAAELVERGILVQAIRPPTVAPGTSRLRVTLRSSFTQADLDRLATALADVTRGKRRTPPDQTS